MNLKFTIVGLLLVLPFCLSSQADKVNIAATHVESNTDKLGLIPSDVTEIKVSDIYKTKHNGVTHVYFQQLYKGIPVSDAIINVNILKNDEVLSSNSNFVSNLIEKVESSDDSVTPEIAIVNLATEVGFKSPSTPQMLKKDGDKHIYAPNSYSHREMTAQKMYARTKEGGVRLAWDVFMADSRNHDTWSCKIDAETGEVLRIENLTIKCNHSEGSFHVHTENCSAQHIHKQQIRSQSNAMMGSTYRVYPLPAESPLDGNHELITDPYIPEASPYGWHDLNGQEGNETTITRGNNIHAYEDLDGNQVSGGNEPAGSGIGGDPNVLTFDFAHDLSGEPEASTDADVVNLFYAANMVHDISYLLGFDEQAGNFQFNNYGNDGEAGDAVEANALDGTGTDNASFSLSSDGNQSYINMFKWNVTSNGVFSISEPRELEGIYETALPGDNAWGFDISFGSIDVTGEVAFVKDADPLNPLQGCGETVNTDEVNGKIAMIYRGTCQFGTKALNAQNAGAIAAIICNIPGADSQNSDGNAPVGMLAGVDGGMVTIPTFMMGNADCNAIRASIESGIPVTARVAPQENTGPAQLSGGYDNGVIAHEYAHGISSRLIGGPSSLCMTGFDEQMGEGWSDIFTLMLTAREGQTGAEPRGIGNYVAGNNAEGRGIRRFPYSTDMDINPQTFDDIKTTTAPHPLGEVWTACLWDMFWKFVDLYGFDPDWTNKESGNFIAAQLVVDGMKMIGCDVGFEPGRDAILAADKANHNSAHECLIWEVFARRGLGYFADGGSSNDRDDGTEDYELAPACLDELKIRKIIPELAALGQEITVTLIVANYTDDILENATVSDFIPEGFTYVDGSGSIPGNVMGDNVFFDFENFEVDREDTITYRMEVNGVIASQLLYRNQVETNDELDRWERQLGEGTNIWRTITSSQFPVRSGDQAWYVKEIDDDTDQILLFDNIEVTGSAPALRFYHRINTQLGRNGGYVEYSTDGIIWLDARDLFMRNGYPSPIQYTTFAIPSHSAFSGPDNIYRDSWINLSSFIGQTISVRFRFGTTPGTAVNDETFADDAGWFIDDLDILDLASGETQACFGDMAQEVCTPFFVTIINDELSSSTEEIEIEGLDVTLYPNPASDLFTLKINSDRNLDARLTMASIDGRIINRQEVRLLARDNFINVPTAHLDSGFYLVHLQSGDRVLTRKVLLQQ